MKKRITVYLEKEDYQKLKQLKEQQDETISRLLRQAIRLLLKSKSKEA